MTGPAAWWDAAFRDAYLVAYAPRDDASAAREAVFAATALRLRAGERVLDAACGAGRHARALAATGVRVVGVDRSAALLAEAARRGGGPTWVRGDLRALPFRDGAFDALVSFFTSFGYFDEDGDRAQIAGFRRVLRHGGRLLLDFLNAPRIRATLVAESERVVGGRTVRERRAIRGVRVEKDVEVCEDGAVVASWRESVRLWSRDEVAALLEDARLRVVAEHGNLAGGAWSAGAERLVVCAEAR